MDNRLETGSRVRMIDTIRGFSLLGILISNMLIFQYGIYGKDEMEHFDPSKLDAMTHKLLTVFVEGSFMPIFMFLFGYSLFKLRESLVQQGLRQGPALVRRFLLLIGFGMLHSVLLWEGDILLAYGATGFILLLFVNRKVKTLLVWGIALSTVMLLIGFLPDEESTGATSRMNEYVEQSIAVYGEGSYTEVMDFRLNEDPLGLPLGVMLASVALAPLMLLPMFLFGIVAARKQWFHNPLRERRANARLAVLFVPIGLALKAVAVWQISSSWSFAFIATGGLVLALGYIFTMAAVLGSISKSNVVVSAFQAIGRMSMTNYIMQTVICTTVFYGYGLGWFGDIGVLNGLLLALLIYSVQAVVTSFMLRSFKNGPLERLLRMWTYLTFSGKARTARGPGAGEQEQSVHL
ncbi:DUF418 domain-containing protein [Paenibacillus harenae]|uniref:DUF418 domain-containing protein n=1 Tax=Paenibacillus harenae TaxID=306543 RepID=UPI002792DA74|nr:DUF418 domain-containing protein [Paenibacillus harenae]MDQ0063128.1 uncharacterized protein [Paenibacillus harenae]